MLALPKISYGASTIFQTVKAILSVHEIKERSLLLYDESRSANK